MVLPTPARAGPRSGSACLLCPFTGHCSVARCPNRWKSRKRKKKGRTGSGNESLSPHANTRAGVYKKPQSEGKGVRHLLCEAPEGPFRQKGPDPFSLRPKIEYTAIFFPCK